MEELLVGRRAPIDDPNMQITEATADDWREKPNTAWLAEARPRPGSLILLGGTSLMHFTVRAAQASTRLDLSPSYWSQVGIAADADGFWTVPLDGADPDLQAVTNGIRWWTFDEIADQAAYPNIAVIEFVQDGTQILQGIELLRKDRGVLDLLVPILAWLGYAWSAGVGHNPLRDGRGVPSAAFVEAVFAMVAIDMKPHMTSLANCPEAIWQAARWWWRDFYQVTVETQGKDGNLRVPHGAYLVRQPEAAMRTTNVPRLEAATT